MSYRIETAIPITFVDGQALIPLQGGQIDLYKLDSVKEFRTVLAALAQVAVAQQVTPPAATVPPTGEPDLDAQADKIREEFQRVADKASEQLARYAGSANVDSAKG